jgi:hypothetical protein
LLDDAQVGDQLTQNAMLMGLANASKWIAEFQLKGEMLSTLGLNSTSPFLGALMFNTPDTSNTP